MHKLIFISLFILLGISLFAQNTNKKFSLYTGMDYTTSAQIFLSPNSSDLFIRNKSFELSDLFSPTIDLRYQVNEDIIVGFSTEYVVKSEKAFNQTIVEGSQIIQLEVEDGVVFIPAELSVYYLMPFSTEQFKFTMGAGIGYYFGAHTRILGNTEIENVEKNTSFGLLVSIGMEYLILEQLGARLDMKFRDPEIKISSMYKDSTSIYNGREIRITKNTFDTKINLNGISFLLGLTFHF
jgi:outer membrane protein W